MNQKTAGAKGRPTSRSGGGKEKMKTAKLNIRIWKDARATERGRVVFESLAG